MVNFQPVQSGFSGQYSIGVNTRQSHKLMADRLLETIESYEHARHATELIGDLYFFKFQNTECTEKKLDALDLPKDTQIVCVFREDQAYWVSNLEMLQEVMSKY